MAILLLQKEKCFNTNGNTFFSMWALFQYLIAGLRCEELWVISRSIRQKESSRDKFHSWGDKEYSLTHATNPSETGK